MAVSSDGALLWLLTAPTAVGKHVSLRAAELASELSVWSLLTMHRIARVEIAPHSFPTLAAATPQQVVLGNSLGAFCYQQQGDSLQLIGSVPPREGRDAEPQAQWWLTAPFAYESALLVGLESGRNLSANGAWRVISAYHMGTNEVPGFVRLEVRRVADDALVAAMDTAVASLGIHAICIDDTCSTVVFSAGRAAYRWNLGAGQPPQLLPIHPPSTACCLAISLQHDAIAFVGDWLAVYSLSTGRSLALEMMHVGQHVAVSAALNMGVILRDQQLTKVLPTTGAVLSLPPVPPAPDVLSEQATAVAFFDDALAVCTAAAKQTVLHVFEAGSNREIASVVVPAKITELRSLPNGAGVVAVAQTGELYAIRQTWSPLLERWETGRIDSHDVAVCAMTGLVVVCHGTRGLRGKNYNGNRRFETSDGMSVWAADGRVVFNQAMHLMPQSVAVDSARGLVWLHSGGSVSGYPIAAMPAAMRELGRAAKTYAYPFDIKFEEPSPRLLPHGRGMLTCQQNMLVAWEFESQRAVVIAPAACDIVAMAGNGCRVLLRSIVDGSIEYACYDTAQSHVCYKRWRCGALGPAALSFDGRYAVLTGGDQLFEVTMFDS